MRKRPMCFPPRQSSLPHSCKRFWHRKPLRKINPSQENFQGERWKPSSIPKTGSDGRRASLPGSAGLTMPDGSPLLQIPKAFLNARIALLAGGTGLYGAPASAKCISATKPAFTANDLNMEIDEAVQTI